MKNELVIIRGWSGSGKTTLAKQYIGYEHFEADMFFEKDGKYNFDPRNLSDAHKWCQNSVKEAILNGKNVVVSNTFSRVWEMQFYLDLKSFVGKLIVIQAKGNFKNVHNVPESVVENMKKRWEYFPEGEL